MKKYLLTILVSTLVVFIGAGEFQSPSVPNKSLPIYNSAKIELSSTSKVESRTRSISISQPKVERSILDWIFKPKPPVVKKKVITPPTVDQNIDILVSQLLTLHNSERSKRKLPNLVLNDKLSLAALVQVADLATRDNPNTNMHQGNDGSTPWKRIAAAGYRYKNASENAAAGWPDTPYFKGIDFTPEISMTGWMGSSGHKANILGPYKDVGFAIGTAKSGRRYYITTFGSP